MKLKTIIYLLLFLLVFVGMFQTLMENDERYRAQVNQKRTAHFEYLSRQDGMEVLKEDTLKYFDIDKRLQT